MIEPVEVWERAALIVDRAGLVYLFGGGRATDLPNLHYELTGRERIEEWDEETGAVWRLRGDLPLRGVAWYGEWLRGRGVFVAERLLGAALSWVGAPADEEAAAEVARALSADAGLLYETLLLEGPLSSIELRQASGLMGRDNGTAYSRALRALRRRLLITTFGSEAGGGGWDSAVYEVTGRAFDVALPDRRGGISALVAAYRSAAIDPSADRAARLFSAPVVEVRALW